MISCVSDLSQRHNSPKDDEETTDERRADRRWWTGKERRLSVNQSPVRGEGPEGEGGGSDDVELMHGSPVA